VSAGSTGAQMAASLFILGRIKGVSRPALGAFLPSEDGMVLLIDVGANAECKPNHLLQFGLMGAVFVEYIYDIAHPRVALLNIGEEKSKGTELTRKAYELMEESIPNDGFTGNVVLKFAESVMGVFKRKFKQNLGRNLFALVGAFLVRHAFTGMKKSFDYQGLVWEEKQSLQL